MEIDEGVRGKNLEIDRRGWKRKRKRKVTESHDFLFRWPVEPRLLGLTPWGQLSAIDSPASYTPDMPSHAKHRVTSIFARMSADTRAILHTTVTERVRRSSPGTQTPANVWRVLAYILVARVPPTSRMASVPSDTLLLRQSMKTAVYGATSITHDQGYHRER